MGSCEIALLTRSVRLPQRLRAQEVVGHGDQAVVADIGYLAHSCDAHVSAPGKQAGDEGGHVRGLPGMAAKDVGESVHEPALTLRKMQHIADIRLRKLIEEGVIRRLALSLIFQRPACARYARLNLEVLILSRGDAPVDFRDARFKLFFQLF
jgi:hypothetical protein